MKLKISSGLKTITAGVLAAAREVSRIDEVTRSTRDSEPGLRESLQSAKVRLANSDVSVALDGAAPDSAALDAMRDASEAIERASGRLAGLETRRAESVAKLVSLETSFQAARGNFAEASKQTIEADIIRPLVAQLRAAYALVCALESACNVPPYLELAVGKVELPSVLDASVDLLKFQVRHQDLWVGGNATDAGALELTSALSDVIEAAAALRTAA